MMHTAPQPAISLWPNAARDAREAVNNAVRRPVAAANPAHVAIAAGCDGSADLCREPPSSPNAVGSLLASSNIVMPDFSCCARIA
mmetsp:Transcript_4481/g.14447  ORF Transcript_4481/g.14447 Transcript_4481/m.14447 type:complete len:85 (-) Transcript_4481:1580-1834(-)